MNQVSKETFSSFDTGTKPSDDSHPERFYHGFVLGLLAGEVKRYEIRSNRESDYGRYDVVMIPRNPSLYPVLPAVIMEFKDMDRKKEASLHDTAQEALRQIRDLEYNTEILERGIKPEHIHYYGFAFPRGGGSACGQAARYPLSFFHAHSPCFFLLPASSLIRQMTETAGASSVHGSGGHDDIWNIEYKTQQAV